MTIVERKFGTEIVTSKGKIHKFDSIECLAAYYLKNRLNQKDVHSVLVTDFNKESKFLNAFEAVYLCSSQIRSPMGMNLSAFFNYQQARAMLGNYGGQIMEWGEVLALINDEWLRRGK
jgi:copper chaperone NosL